MILFEDDIRVAAQKSTLSRFIPNREKGPIDAAGFAAWPRHMQAEFAAMTRERGIPDEIAARSAGMEIRAFQRCRAADFRPHALEYSDAKVLAEDAPTQPHMLAAAKRRSGDAD